MKTSTQTPTHRLELSKEELREFIIELLDKRLGRQQQVPEYQPFLPACLNAIICDLDGTVAVSHDRLPYEPELCGRDLPHSPVIWALKRLIGNDQEIDHIFFISGREAKMNVKLTTYRWLKDYVVSGLRGQRVNYSGGWSIHLRPEGCRLPDEVLKQKIYEEKIRRKYNVLVVLEDRPEPVKMWRRLGLPCFQVAPGE